jgi:hypothetical protein
MTVSFRGNSPSLYPFSHFHKNEARRISLWHDDWIIIRNYFHVLVPLGGSATIYPEEAPMPGHPKKIKLNLEEIEAVDIPTMRALSNTEYRAFVNNEGLFFIDHHDVLRSSPDGYPLATTLEQLNILIEELVSLCPRMQSREAA